MQKRNAYHLFTLLLIYRSLVYHLLSLSTPTRVQLKGSRTNLVIEDGFPQIFEEPGNLFIVLDLVGELSQLSFNVCKLAGRNSAPILNGKEQHAVLGRSAASVLPHNPDLF